MPVSRRRPAIRPSAALVGLLALAAALWLAPAGAASPPHAVRIGSLPHRPPGTRVIGNLPGVNRLQLNVVLQPRDPAALAAYVAAVSTPGSPDYHRYLSVTQFAQQFGAAPSQVAAVTSSLKAHGLAPGPVSSNGLAIPVQAPASSIEHAFSISIQRVVLPTGQTAFANTQAPLLDASIAPRVQSVLGLDDLARPHPLALAAHTAPRAAPRAVRPHVDTGGPQPCSSATSAAGDQGAYTADEIASAYRFDGIYSAGDEGAGQTVAVYELEGNIPSDIVAYEGCYGIAANVSYVPVDGGAGTVDVANDDGLETELDVESLIGLAPKANVLVYQGPDSGSGPYDTYSKMIADDRAKVISTSWGLCEQDLSPGQAAAENTLFEEAAVQGQTVLAAAGDEGSEDCDGDNTSHSDALAVDDPGSQPLVTDVGGTSLSSLGPPPTETVWNNPAVGAGGGGISKIWSMPSYQSSASPSLNVVGAASSGAPCGRSSGDCREVPDVSADADTNTGVLAYYDGDGTTTDYSAWQAVGGTSAAAPTWAALISLADASRACSGSPIGFANPSIYRTAGSSYGQDFNDVTSGNNDYTGDNGGVFSAGTAYDMASGLGTPLASNLAPALCGQVVVVSNPNSQTSLVRTPSRLAVTASDPRGGSLTYGAVGLPPGLSINPVSGVISGTATHSGIYHVSVSATDSSGTTGSTTFTWTVVAAGIDLVNPGNQTGAVGAPVHLRIRATDNNGGALVYTTHGLPHGLAINHATGLIFGRPTVGGTFKVTVYATEAGSPSRGTSFKWFVKGPPSVVRGSISGITQGRPRLAFLVLAGADAPAIKSISIVLPRGLRFTAYKRGWPQLKRRLHHGVLTLWGRFAARRLPVAVASPALTASSGLAYGIAQSHVRTLAVTVWVTDANRSVTKLVLRLRP